MPARQMATLYEELKDRKQSIKELTSIGVVSPTVLRDIEIVEKFDSRPEACKECRYEWIAKMWSISSDRVKRIVIRMKS